MAAQCEVVWPPMAGIGPEDVGPSSLERFQEPHPSLTSASSLGAFCAKSGTRQVRICLPDGDVRIPEELLTAFSSFFKEKLQFVAGVAQSGDWQISSDVLSKSIVDHLKVYIVTGALPNDSYTLYQFYRLAEQIRHGYMARQMATKLVNRASDEMLLHLTEEARIQPTGVLYPAILERLASLCQSAWFTVELLYAGRLRLAMLQDLLRRDDLCVDSERQVLEIVQNWLFLNPQASLSEFTDIIRINWLHTNDFARYKTELARTDTAVDFSLPIHVRPRHNYLRHTHFVVIEPRSNRLVSLATVCAKGSGRPRVVSTVNLLRPSTCLIVERPFKVASLESFGKDQKPTAFLTTQFGLAYLKSSSRGDLDLQWQFYCLERYTQGVVTYLTDVCAWPGGFLVCLQRLNMHHIIAITEHDSGEVLVISRDIPMWNTRLSMLNNELHIWSDASTMVVVCRSQDFGIERTHFNGLNIDVNEIEGDDLQEGVDVEVTARKLQNLCGGPSSKPTSGKYPQIGSNTRFRVICETDGGRDQTQLSEKATIIVRESQGRRELLRLVGLPREQFLGFVPHRLFTWNIVCEPLPRVVMNDGRPDPPEPHPSERDPSEQNISELDTIELDLFEQNIAQLGTVEPHPSERNPSEQNISELNTIKLEPSELDPSEQNPSKYEPFEWDASRQVSSNQYPSDHNPTGYDPSEYHSSKYDPSEHGSSKHDPSDHRASKYDPSDHGASKNDSPDRAPGHCPPSEHDLPSHSDDTDDSADSMDIS